MSELRRPWEELHAANARLTVERDTYREALETIGRELERASDVRVNRTRIIGNAHLIVQRTLSGLRGDAA